jgi:DNA primase
LKSNKDNQNHKNEQSPEESTTTKYMIYADFNIDGVVEKPDVVGALFGQTEGLLSEHLELRELQKGGRVGRIQVSLSVRGGKTRGSLSIPSSLDKVETSILAAAVETVDRIGPCNAQISIKKIEDVREEKRKQIISRASDLLKKWDSKVAHESSELHDEVIKAARVGGITSYYGLPAGPELEDSDTIIIVEGRADITACMKAAINNTIAVEGASIPKKVSELSKKRTAIAFLDGDRGGDLIFKELLMFADVDYIARAPVGKEVEDLGPKEIVEQLSKKVPIENAKFITDIRANNLLEKAITRKATKKLSREMQAVAPPPVSAAPVRSQPARTETPARSDAPARTEKQPYSSSRPPQQRDSQRSSYSRSSSSRPSDRDRRSGPRDSRRPDSRREYVPRRTFDRVPEALAPLVKEIEGKDKQEGHFYDAKMKVIKKVPVEKLYEEIEKFKKTISKVVFDGIITQRLIDLCKEKDVEELIGAVASEIKTRPVKPKVYTFAE